MVSLLFDIDGLLQMSITGLFVGFGSAIGQYFAQRSFIKHLDKIGSGVKK